MHKFSNLRTFYMDAKHKRGMKDWRLSLSLKKLLLLEAVLLLQVSEGVMTGDLCKAIWPLAVVDRLLTTLGDLKTHSNSLLYVHTRRKQIKS